MICNKFKVIDAHCHIYPTKIATRAVAGTDSFYGLHSKFDGTVDTLLKVGNESGVDRFIVQSVATSPKQVESINRFIARETEKNGGKLVGLGTLHPDSENIEDDVKTIMELGLHGVKLHPDIQQFKIDDYRCLKIYEQCEKYGLPILMHTGDSRYDYSNPNRLLPVMQIYTELTVVGAHLGGWSVWDSAVNDLSGLKNLYFDCSSCFPFIGNERVGNIIKRYGTDRVLFGTDYPMWSPKDEIKNLLSLNLPDSDYEKIFYKNAIKVFKL